MCGAENLANCQRLMKSGILEHVLPPFCQISIIPNFILKSTFLPTDMCNSHPSSKKLFFTSKWRQLQETTTGHNAEINGSQGTQTQRIDTPTLQLRHLRSKAAFRRGVGKTVRARGPGSLL